MAIIFPLTALKLEGKKSLFGVFKNSNGRHQITVYPGLLPYNCLIRKVIMLCLNIIIFSRQTFAVWTLNNKICIYQVYGIQLEENAFLDSSSFN